LNGCNTWDTQDILRLVISFLIPAKADDFLETFAKHTLHNETFSSNLRPSGPNEVSNPCSVFLKRLVIVMKVKGLDLLCSSDDDGDDGDDADKM
jgi:hypothetical protein